VPKEFEEYREPFKACRNNEMAVGILERDKRFIGVASSMAKEVLDKEIFVREFDLGFEKDVRWRTC
jgi:hypothetical protein